MRRGTAKGARESKVDKGLVVYLAPWTTPKVQRAAQGGPQAPKRAGLGGRDQGLRLRVGCCGYVKGCGVRDGGCGVSVVASGFGVQGFDSWSRLTRVTDFSMYKTRISTKSVRENLITFLVPLECLDMFLHVALATCVNSLQIDVRQAVPKAGFMVLFAVRKNEIEQRQTMSDLLYVLERLKLRHLLLRLERRRPLAQTARFGCHREGTKDTLDCIPELYFCGNVHQNDIGGWSNI